MMEITAAQAFHSLQDAVFVSLGIMAVLGALWKAFGRSAYRRLVDWFEKLEKRFDAIDQKQSEAQTERETERRAAERRDSVITQKLDTMSSKMDTLTATVQDHHAALYGTGVRSGLIGDVAYLQGREDQRKADSK